MLNIEYSHRMDDGRCERCTPVVRLDELRRWLEEHFVDAPATKVALMQNELILDLLAELDAQEKK